MGIFFVYILKSSACLAIFYLFYKLLLSRDTFHRFNRIALLSLIILSVIIPFCEITLEEATAIQRPVMDLERLLLAVPVETSAKVVGQPLWLRILVSTYLLGGLCLFCLFIFTFYRLYQTLRKGTSSIINGIRVITTEHSVTAFSWMRIIVISRKDYEESGTEILAHEMAHIKAHHSIDILISQVCLLFHWFNPAAWLLQQELRSIHEYEADESVLNNGVDAKRYQLLLIKKAVGSQRFTSMANSFNHSSLKKRIAMMLRQKSNPWARLKYFYVFPLAAITIVAFARPEISKELEKISSAKISEIFPITEIIQKDTALVTAIHKPKTKIIVDTTKVEIDPEIIIQLENTAVYLEEHKEEIDKHIEKAIAAAKINETVEAELARQQPIIEKAVQEAMAEIAKHQPEIDKAIEESMKQAEIESKLMREESVRMKAETKKVQEEAVRMEAETRKMQEESRRMEAESKKIVNETRRLDTYRGIVYIDGLQSTIETLNKLNPDRIDRMTVYKGEQAIQKYGDKGRNGVIEITTKK